MFLPTIGWGNGKSAYAFLLDLAKFLYTEVVKFLQSSRGKISSENYSEDFAQLNIFLLLFGEVSLSYQKHL